MTHEDYGEEILEKVARMMYYNASNEDIAAACGIDVAEIDRIKLMPEFLRFKADLVYNDFDTIQTMNDAWDHLEQAGLATLAAHMQYSKDPEFALKVSAVANKAQRRGIKHNQPINPAMTGGSQAVIHLQQTFIEQVNNQNNVLIEDEEKMKLFQGKKSENFMAPDEAEKLLLPDRDKDVSIEAKFAATRFTMDK